MSPTNRQRILNVISTFRPAFRQVALGLTDLDLVLVEEEFERLLLVIYIHLFIRILSNLYRITIEYSVQWEYQLAYGAEQVKSIKVIKNLLI
jgi:hypothetical protein